MEIKSSYLFIQIGLSTRLLQNLKSTQAYAPKKELGSLIRNLTNAGFAVSLAAIEKSQRFSEISDRIESLEDTAAVPEELLKKLRSRMKDLETVIFAEATTKKVFTLPERRYDVHHMMSSPEKLLKTGAYLKLSILAQSDFQSACRCVVFGESTAAAFHILRCTEDTLKKYYFHHRKKKRLEKPMWGNMLDQLKAKQREKPPATLLKSLDLIRDSYRNPTQHPEAAYTTDTVQDLFGVCIDALGKMLDELP